MALQPRGKTTTHCQRVKTQCDGSAEILCFLMRNHPCSLCCPHVVDVEFKEGEKEHFVEIEILYDGEREMREAFTVHMKPDDNMVAEIQVTRRLQGHTHTYKYKPVASPICAHVQCRIFTHVSMRCVTSALC